MKNIKLFLVIFSLVFVFALSASAQSVTFTSIDGESIDLEAQKGKVVVLAIGAHNGCRCQTSKPRISTNFPRNTPGEMCCFILSPPIPLRRNRKIMPAMKHFANLRRPTN